MVEKSGEARLALAMQIVRRRVNQEVGGITPGGLQLKHSVSAGKATSHV